LRDLDTGNILFSTEKGGIFVQSSRRFYVRLRGWAMPWHSRKSMVAG